MAEIAAASSEQSSGIEQVNGAVTQMDEVTQQNAALVEEAAAAAQSMQDQADALARTVSVFRLAQGALPALAVPHGAGAALSTRLATPTVRKLPAAGTRRVVARPVTAANEAPAPRKVAGGADDWTEF